MNADMIDWSAPDTRMSMSPQVSQPRRRLPTGAICAAGYSACRMRHDRPRDRIRRRQQMAAGVLFPLVDRLQDERFLLGSHPLDRAHAAVARGPLEVVERLHAQLAMEHGDRFRPDALQPHHVENRRRKLRHQAAVIFASRRFRRFRGSAPPGPCRCREFRASRSHRASRARADGWRRCRRRYGTRES